MEHHSSKFKPAVVAGLGLTLLLATAARAETESLPCEPSPTVKQALRELPLPSPERGSMLETLLERFPGDLFVHRAYQDAAGFPGGKDLAIVRYRKLAEQHPGDSLYAYLAARALIGVQTKEAITQLESQLSQWPDFPWPHLALVKIYQAPAFRDPNKASQHLEAFLEACPASLEGYGFLRSMEPSEFTRGAAGRLRQLLRNATEPEAARAYSALWALEFRLQPSGEHAALRRQVVDYLKRLRAADPGNSPDYLLALSEGYRLVGDTKNLEWVGKQLRTKFIPNSAGPSYAHGEWKEKNPYPKPGDPPEKHKAHQQALVKATGEWVRKWPESVMGWHYRFTAVLGAEQVTAAVVEDAAEGLLNAKDKSGRGTFGILPMELQVAELYAVKGVRPERAAELLAEGITELEQGLRFPSPPDLVPQQGLADPKTGHLRLEWVGWRIASDVALKLEDACTARDAVQQMKVLMRKLKPSGEADAKDANAARQQYQHAVRQAAYWERLGSLAEMEGRGMDALVFYQNALVVRPQPRKGMPRRPKDELAEKARVLWKQYGGTNAGWQAWLSRKELGAPAEGAPDLLSLWTRLEKPLPDFELTDLGGSKWTLDDLKGKVTFANVWATWCEPCRVEMPHVEKLYEKFKDRKDVLVLTFNIDDNIGLIEPFLKKGGYSFPVLPATSLVDAVFQSLGIPQNWIIDTNGVLQVMQRGFGPSGEKWTGQMLEAIEKVRTAR